MNALRQRQELDLDLGGDAEAALGTDEKTDEIELVGVRPAPPSATTRPSGKTTSRERIYLEVTPYLRQWGPPEFSATFPPIVQALCEDGSGA